MKTQKQKQPERQEPNPLEINPLKLDKGWVEQPDLAHKWYKKLAKAKLVVDEAEDSLKLVTAQLENEIRAKPERFKLPKATDNSVKAAIPLQEQYQDACKALREAKFEAGLVLAMVQGVENKKRGLENMVKLHGQDYFAEPISPPEDREAGDKFKDKATAAAMQRKKRRREEADDDE